MIARTIEAIILVDTLDLSRLRFAATQSLELAKRVGARAWEAFGISYQGLIDYYDGEHDTALCWAEEACRMANENAPGFVSAWVHGVLMLVTEDAEQRRYAVAAAEEVLAGDCIGHNHLWFRRYAIEASLNIEDWDEAERHARALEDFTSSEPLPWADYWVRWARAIGAGAAEGPSHDTLRELRALRERAAAMSLRAALPLLDRCLNAATESTR